MAAELKELPAPGPNADVIAEIRKVLEAAERGELRGFVLAGVLDFPGDHGNSVTWRAGDLKRAEMVIALERAKLRLMGFVEDIDIGVAL